MNEQHHMHRDLVAELVDRKPILLGSVVRKGEAASSP